MRDGDAKNEGRNRRMLDKVIENNRVTIIGEVVSDFTYSHEVFGEGFYMVDIAVNRLSNSVDIIPLMVSERRVFDTCSTLNSLQAAEMRCFFVKFYHFICCTGLYFI